MKRKQFLVLAAAGAFSATFPAVYSCSRPVEYPEALSRPQHLFSIWDPETARAVGNAYRVQHPGEAGRNRLVELLLNDLPVDSADYDASLENNIRSDFASGRTVQVKGWILSISEARQCALFALTSTN
ncbi:MAG: hypothetical protein R3281_17210 [Balneolaceae bacterium]|nr:hypothetical protein [Balneolaceae bacterium]